MVYLRAAIAVTIGLAGLALGRSAQAWEPDGKTAIRYEWVQSPEGASAAPRLRLSVNPVVPVSEVTISFRAPSSITLRLAGIVGAAIPPEISGALAVRTSEARIPLGRMDPGRAVLLEFIVDVPVVGPGGIVTFRVDGIDARGVEVREGTGVPVGQVGAVPKIRDGAAEYPAARPGDRTR